MVTNHVFLVSLRFNSQSKVSVNELYHPTWEKWNDSLNWLLASLSMTYPVNWSSSAIKDLLPMKFDHKSRLKRHERSEHNLFICEHCGVTLSDRFSFMSHERDVHKEKPNGVIMGTVPTIPLQLGTETCPNCNESYKTNKNLRNHLKDKHGYYIYHCQWCSEHNYFFIIQILLSMSWRVIIYLS